MNKQVIVICGPTASGKTSLAARLASLVNAEIICADSRQIYKHLDIGTSKPKPDPDKDCFTYKGIRHHLIDFLSPNATYDAYQYSKSARTTAEDIWKRGKRVVLCGGTGLYIDAFTGRREIGRHNVYDKKIRAKLSNLDLQELTKIAQKENLEAYEDLNESDVKNPRRLVRLIEKTVLGLEGQSINKELWPTHYFQPSFDKDELYSRIRFRVDLMFEQGWIEEVKSILKSGYKETAPALRTMGYREIQSYLRGDLSMEEIRGMIKVAHVKYAKRQITWFKKYDKLISVSSVEDVIKHLEYVLK